MINIYKAIQPHLAKWFGFPEQDTFCQVATVDKNTPRNTPWVRTMRMHALSEAGEVTLLTRTNTAKWQQLQACPNVSICLAYPGHGQIIASGLASLKTTNDNDVAVKACWEELPATIKRYYPTQEPVTVVPKDFGMIVIATTVWEVLQINAQDYFQSLRTLFSFAGNAWYEQAVPVTS